MLDTIQIERGIPIPSEKNGRSRYPFATLEIGASFLVKTEAAARRVSSAANWFSRVKDITKKFKTRRVEEGWRCWRVK